MEVIDYNGEGDWSRDAILDRYARYCTQLGVQCSNLIPDEHTEGDRRWVFPVMAKVNAGIRRGDPACKRIGIEFIEQDSSFPFGATLKSNTARALRQTDLDDSQKERVRRRVVHMLSVGNVPREFKEYAKLLRKIGLGGHRQEIEQCADSDHWRARRYARYFLTHADES